MRTTVTITEPLLENAKQRAAQRGITLSALIEDAVRRYLAVAEATPALPFRLHTVRGRLVEPGLDLDRTSALVALDDEAEFSTRRSEP
jgi:hypothetical protein